MKPVAIVKRFFNYQKRHNVAVKFHDIEMVFLCHDPRLLADIRKYFAYFPLKKGTKKLRRIHCILNIVKGKEYNKIQKIFKPRKEFEAFPNVHVSVGIVDRYYIYRIERSYFLIIDNRTNDCTALMLSTPHKIPMSIEYLLHIVTIEWLRGIGYFVAHASGICHNNKAYLFIGPSGCGKSTTALIGIKNGFSLLGDDQIVLKQTEDGVVAHSFVRPIKLNLDMIKKFKEFKSKNLTPLLTENKQSINFNVDAYFNVHIQPKARVNKIFFILPDGTFEKLKSVDALPLIVDNSFFYSRKEPSVNHFNTLCTLIETVNCYKVGLTYINKSLKGLMGKK